MPLRGTGRRSIALRAARLAALVLLGLVLNQTPARAEFKPPPQLGDGCPTASPAQVGFRPAPLAELLTAVKNGRYPGLHAVLAARGGQLCLEEYFEGHSRDRGHPIRSATKSIGSLLIGIAVDKGFIPGVKVPVARYFPGRTAAWGDMAGAVTIESLLTMTSGFDCDDHSGGGTGFGCERAMARSGDWLGFALDLPLAYPPGEHWAYNSASLILLSQVIRQTTGLSVPLFADKYLFSPLGVTGFRWGFSPQGRAWLAGGTAMRPRDMVKIGQLALNRGRWGEQTLVSPVWLAQSTRRHARSPQGLEYGYLWWRGWQEIGGRRLEAFWAQGNGGQVIFVCPELDLTAAFTGGNYNSMLEFQFMGLLINYLIPALLPPELKPPTIAPSTRMLGAWPGSYGCYRLRLDVSAQNGRLAGRLNGQPIEISLTSENRFVIPHPVFGRMIGRPVTDGRGRVTGLTINAAFAQLDFQRID